MTTPRIRVEYDHQGLYLLVIECPDCGKAMRYPVDTLEPDSTVDCECGVGFRLSAVNIEKLRQAVERERGDADPAN